MNGSIDTGIHEEHMRNDSRTNIQSTHSNNTAHWPFKFCFVLFLCLFAHFPKPFDGKFKDINVFIQLFSHISDHIHSLTFIQPQTKHSLHPHSETRAGACDICSVLVETLVHLNKWFYITHQLTKRRRINTSTWLVLITHFSIFMFFCFSYVFEPYAIICSIFVLCDFS